MITYGKFRPTAHDSAGLGCSDRQSWLVVPCGQNRDSDCLTRSNFTCALEMLGGESDTVEVHRFGHWANGWIELILVAPDSDASEMALSIEASLTDYPVLNESHYSQLETEEAEHVWANCYRNSERIEYIRENRSQFEFSCFADMVACVKGKYFCGYASELLAD